MGRFAIYEAADPVDCSLADWECVRASTYLYPGTGMSDAQAVAFTNAGFEIGLHVNTNCADWTPAQLEAFYTDQLASFAGFLPGIPVPSSERTHCISWSDWVTQAKVKLLHGIRLDTNYYFWPPEWVLNRPGMYTGSGMPMRFADLDGSMIDVYQVTTQMTDESGQSFPYTMDTLLDRALGSEGYYGAFCANMHNDGITHADASAIIASAQARGVPVVSGRQMLTWLDARNASSFDDLAWTGNTLTFDVTTTANARNLEGMLPLQSGAASLVALARDGAGVSFRTETIKGVAYAIFTAEAGSYQADYDIDDVAPVIAGLTATPHGDGTATVSWTTDRAGHLAGRLRHRRPDPGHPGRQPGAGHQPCGDPDRPDGRDHLPLPRHLGRRGGQQRHRAGRGQRGRLVHDAGRADGALFAGDHGRGFRRRQRRRRHHGGRGRGRRADPGADRGLELRRTDAAPGLDQRALGHRRHRLAERRAAGRRRRLCGDGGIVPVGARARVRGHLYRCDGSACRFRHRSQRR